MKVILTKDVPSLGRAGDVKQVSDGYARNFLLARHLALPATSDALSKLQKEQLEQQEKVKRDQAKFAALKTKLESKTFTIAGKADKQHLFAAIKAARIAQVIGEKMGLELIADQIVIKAPLKTLGLNEIEIRFAESLIARVKLNVIAE